MLIDEEGPEEFLLGR